MGIVQVCITRSERSFSPGIRFEKRGNERALLSRSSNALPEEMILIVTH
jgi:hypothetical protein